jgi:hypothetical protein
MDSEAGRGFWYSKRKMKGDLGFNYGGRGEHKLIASFVWDISQREWMKIER